MAGPAGGALSCGVVMAVAGWLLRAWQHSGIPHIPHFSTALGPWMLPPGGMNGSGCMGLVVAGLAGLRMAGRSSGQQWSREGLGPE